jgi:hypothetical protein
MNEYHTTKRLKACIYLLDDYLHINKAAWELE